MTTTTVQTVDVTPAKVDLVAYASSPLTFKANVTSGGTPVNLVAGTHHATIKYDPRNTQPAATLTVTPNAGVPGEATVHLTPTESQLAVTNNDGETVNGYWDWRFTPTVGEPYAIAGGVATINLGVTIT